MVHAGWSSDITAEVAKVVDMAKLGEVAGKSKFDPSEPNANAVKFGGVLTNLLEKEVGIPESGARFGAPVAHQPTPAHGSTGPPLVAQQ